MSQDEYAIGDHWIIFGDGEMARVISTKNYTKKKTSVDYVRFILVPSERVESQYELEKYGQDSKTGAIVMEYKKTDVILIYDGVHRRRYLITQDFNGGNTTLSSRDIDLKNALNDLNRLLKSAEAAKALAYQELDKERTQKQESMRTSVDIILEAMKANKRNLTGEFGNDLGGGDIE